MRVAWQIVALSVAIGLAMAGGQGSRSDESAPLSGFEAAGRWASTARGFPEEDIDLSDVPEVEIKQGGGGGGGFFSFLFDLVRSVGSSSVQDKSSESQPQLHEDKASEDVEDPGQVWHIEEAEDEDEVVAKNFHAESSTDRGRSPLKKKNVDSEAADEFHLDFHKEEQSFHHENGEVASGESQRKKQRERNDASAREPRHENSRNEERSEKKNANRKTAGKDQARQKPSFNMPDGDHFRASHPPIAILAHNRFDALRRLLHSIKMASHSDMSLVWVYQDGDHRAVEKVVKAFFPVKHVRLPAKLQDDKPILSSRLTHNYRFMLEHVLSWNDWAKHVIVLEEDLLLAPDALDFFRWGAETMEEDDSIFCVSGYNDNGFESNTHDPKNVFRGEHFMALGWMVSRADYKAVSQLYHPDVVWDVPFARVMMEHGKECIFPEVPRTKHVGDRTQRSALTTSAASQQLWFDLMNLQAQAGVLTREDLNKGAIDFHSSNHMQLVRKGKMVRCLWEMLKLDRRRDETNIFVFQAKSANPSLDDSWDALGYTFGTLGRGGGLDRMPRGYHQGMIRMRIDDMLTLFLSSESPYLQGLHQDQSFPPAPQSRQQLIEGVCEPPEEAFRKSSGGWRVGNGSKTCEEICLSSKKTCSAGGMWMSLAWPDCQFLDKLMRAKGMREGCSQGCEPDVQGLHTPVFDLSDSVCRLPQPVFMSCRRLDSFTNSHKFCPCK